MTDKVLDRFIHDCEELHTRLRDGQGFDSERFAAVMSGLEALSANYAGRDSVPKEFAAIVFDLSTALYSAAEGYSEEEAEGLFERFDEFCESVRSLLAS